MFLTYVYIEKIIHSDAKRSANVIAAHSLHPVVAGQIEFELEAFPHAGHGAFEASLDSVHGSFVDADLN